MPTSACRLSPKVQEQLRCPACRARLSLSADQLRCLNPECGALFPLVEGIPVLIHEASSVFSIADFTGRRKTYFEAAPPKTNPLKRFLRSLVPTADQNLKAPANYRRFGELLLEDNPAPRVLVLGGSILGQGMQALAENPAVELVESDIAFGPRTALICDAHDIPFEDQAFDGVIAQAVLEHVADPYRCTQEIHRVLKGRGLLYSEIPFMQQVHGGRYDFTRFTHLGQRRLFRRFDEVESGVICGPGMALSWSYQYFLQSFVRSSRARNLLALWADLTTFYLKYFDPGLAQKPGAFDSASGFYFLGRRSETVLSDREIIKLYRGAM
jgi:SAM-dependent methyltransferase